jgi:hypothetical protein
MHENIHANMHITHMTNDDFVFMVFIYGRTTATVSNALMPSSVALSSSKHLVWFVMWDSVTPASAPCSFIITYFSIYVKPLISDACRISLEGGLGRSESVFEIVFLPAMGLGIFDGYQLNLCLNGEEELTWIPSSLFCFVLKYLYSKPKRFSLKIVMHVVIDIQALLSCWCCKQNF